MLSLLAQVRLVRTAHDNWPPMAPALQLSTVLTFHA
jgi:hypothetical protein